MVVESVVGAGVTDERVVKAMLATPRHEFVPPSQRPRAYFDMALPIGSQQTISSPFIVAFMSQCLDPQPTDRVLEIGTGSGYQAAVLSPLVKEVYSIEIVETLGRKAKQTLRRLNYANVHTKVGDGFKGWPEHAPFDKIIVTCSPEEVPPALVEQLREGGLMVIPTGERYQQTLYLMRKVDGRLEAEALRPTLFVPMTGTAEEQRKLQPDPSAPQVINGGFEDPPSESGFVPGWYYQRRLQWIEDPAAPEGRHFVTFHNEVVGRAAHLLQGIPIDGRLVGELELSGFVKYSELQFPERSSSFPMIAVTLYDGNRREIGHHWIGPFHGTALWTQVRKSIRIPAESREGILRIGLFGATGKISLDAVTLEARPR
jgi:protein-L-isoaspartate(D-aspartate) O-methyltransferase